MNTTRKYLIFGLVAVVVIGLASGYAGVRTGLQSVDTRAGSTNNNRIFSFDEGIAVDNTLVIDGNGSLIGAASSSVTSTFTGATYITSAIFGNAVTTVTPAATTTISAAQICTGGGTINWAPSVANATATLPTAQALQSACLTNVGSVITVQVRNTSTTSSFNVVAGTGETIFHVKEVATSTAANNLVSSSTPMQIRLRLTLASSSDSTAAAETVQFTTP